jgi:hypothetical protein
LQHGDPAISDDPDRIGDADAVLPSAFDALGPGINLGNQFPSALFQIGVFPGFGNEIVRCSVAGVELIDLWPAGCGVPRISIDLLEFASTAQIHLNPSAPDAGGEEKVLGRLGRLGGDFPVEELFEATAVGVGFTGYNRKLGCRSGVTLGGQWDVREGEAWGFLSLGVIADGRLDAGERYPCGEQKSRNYGSQPNVIDFWQWRCKRNHGFIL